MPERKRVNKWLWGMVILIVLIVAVVVGVILANQPRKETEEDKPQGTSETEETKKTESQKEESKTEEKVPEKEPVPQYSGDNPNEAESLTGVISYAGVSGDNLIIRVNIDQYLNSGSCKLSLVRGGASVYSKEVAIESSVSTSTCDGFLIPVSEVGAGNFAIEITLNSGEKYGKMVGEVNI